ncbi:MAG: TlyA family rRNA (cytidine-2'-O)-methyltransferase [Actinobacteria bacterium HGW-Actinobacteria-1]|jgi:23S rRNA (cytidine1920-2'-O)/16S rRNA (cytidine1409-2'-O)-methyltransferase|nr:MAG: TlyA family rRNA (cytidine-2'-O)-methyltransferase [Actinobacteria bacterium HGW-Actinobacteria-1]
MAGRRADVELVERGLFASRERARAAILAGEVKVDGVRIDKAGHQLSTEAVIEVAERQRYVSRGGHKLEGALDAFGVDVAGLRAIDVGASTGGFTDCLLQRGAVSVVALDVGYGQLAWSLRTDERVTVVERTNVRDADLVALGAPFDIVVIDVSFIALDRVMPKLLEAAGADGQVVALVKPQFEAGKGRVGKKGVVRDAIVHEDVLAGVIATVEAAGRVVRGVTWSPLKGPEGNIEFWIWFGSTGEPANVDPASVVQAAHQVLGD